MATISREELLERMRRERYAVQASVSPAGEPQAATVGIVVSDAFEIFFDTLDSTRKAANMRGAPAAALVIGPTTADSSWTIQVEGTADEPQGKELERLLELYFASFPDGKLRRSWPELMYWRITPTWLRYSNFAANPPQIVEFCGEELAALTSTPGRSAR